MIYAWVDLTSGQEIEVERPMADSQVEPTKEESGMADKEYRAAVWQRIITGGSATIGFGLKGSW